MTIAEAKEFIKDTVELYLKKDEFGDYRIPVVKQRPVFLVGAPGIGKTAIMSQIASELGIALVSYSMTHHTRQSALGLPFIREKEFGGNMTSVSEYTMSEIIASVYDTMEGSGVKEGILFLDEINCVSETLYPSMLGFLQYKVFGRHTVPEGWVIVTAGNPPEFNKAVREFDVVTLDRLKVIEVEADYPAWKKYAADAGIHGAILNFLETDRDSFYRVETTANGRNYVTARGWEDLSDLIYLYEETGKKVTENLIGQYIKNDTTVREFSAYYDLYRKYQKTYDLEEIFSGNLNEKTADTMKKAPTDEKLALTGLLGDALKAKMRPVTEKAGLIANIRGDLSEIIKDGENAASRIEGLIRDTELKTEEKKKAGTLSSAEKTKARRKTAFLKELLDKAADPSELKAAFNGKVGELKAQASDVKQKTECLFSSFAEVFGEDSDEMLLLVTELTLSKDSASFFANFGSEAYEKYHTLLMVNDRREDLRNEILELLS